VFRSLRRQQYAARAGQESGDAQQNKSAMFSTIKPFLVSSPVTIASVIMYQ
jgi:hypothetical protein